MNDYNLHYFDAEEDAWSFAKEHGRSHVKRVWPEFNGPFRYSVRLPITKEERNARSRKRCQARFFYRRILALNQRRKRLGQQAQIKDPKKATYELGRLWIKQRGRCYFTGIRLTRDNAQLDHLLPVSKGGSDKISNLCFVVEQVNQAKGGMNKKEFLAMCARVYKYQHGEA
jgi:hypothetical protein